MHTLSSKPHSSPSLSLRCVKLALPLAVAGWAIAANQTFGATPTLTVIPTIANPGNDTSNEGRAITPDGKYVVGLSGVGTPGAPDWGTWIGFFYNSDTGLSINPTNPAAGTYSCILTGVGYRTNSGVREVVMDGWDNSVYHAQWMTPDGGVTWGGKRRNTSIALGNSTTALFKMAAANSLGANGNNSVYHTIFKSANLINHYTMEGSNAWPATCFYASYGLYTYYGGMNAVAALTGRAAGYFQDQDGGQKYNFVIEYPIKVGDTNHFYGLDGTAKGQAFSINADGTIVFGASPLSPSTGSTNYGYRAVLTGRAGTLATSSVHLLPNFANTTGSLTLATPYGCTANGLYAVGMSYRGVETAVLWNTSDPDYTKWTVMDLYQYAVSWGIQGSFLSLNRAYSCGITPAGDIAITGYGVWTPDAGVHKYTRAFRMTVAPSNCGGADVGGFSTPILDTATTVTVTGCDPTATAVNVYHNGVLIGSAAGGSASVAVTVTPPVLVAGWVLKATQVVNAQESCLASAPSATVTSANPPPLVVLATPTNSAVFWTPATIPLSATVTSNGNTINYVGFYQGAILIANVTNPPYAYSWSGMLAGTYSLSVRVAYNSGLTVNSAACSVTVSNSAQAASLAVIPLAPWSSAVKNQARAISPDGLYVVGACYYAAMGDAVGYVYDVANNMVIQPGTNSFPDPYPPSILTGVGYRTDPTYGKQLILDGLASGYHANYSTTDGGLSWGAQLLDSSHAGLGLPAANSLGAVAASNAFYTVIGNYPQDVDNQRVLWTCRGSNIWSATGPCQFSYDSFVIDNPDAGNMNGVAGSTGRAVGWYRDNWTYRPAQVLYNCVVEFPPPGGSGGTEERYAKTWFFRGLANTNMGEAWSVSADGNKIFGRSPTPTDSNWHAYKAIVTSAMNSLQGIPKQLPDFPDTAGSSRLATPYGCSADGRYVAGMNYRGAERAVLWDTGDANANNWTVMDLTDRAAAEGILGGFTTLTRAYSVGVNSAGYPVVAGIGDHSSGATRAFVMVVGTPRPMITSITGMGTGNVTVNYANTVSGKNYILQYKTNLNNPADWYSAGTKTATGSTDSQTQTGVTTGLTYYRVYCQ